MSAKKIPDMPELPGGPSMVQTGPYSWTVRRLTDEDLAVICDSEYGRWCEAVADRRAKEDGISKDEWDREPECYLGECFKQCYSLQHMTKGSVYEFANYGIYVCNGCGYAYPPGCEPKRVELERN